MYFCFVWGVGLLYCIGVVVQLYWEGVVYCIGTYCCMSDCIVRVLFHCIVRLLMSYCIVQVLLSYQWRQQAFHVTPSRGQCF